MAPKPSLSWILFALGIAYISYSGLSFYHVFYPSQCTEKPYCIGPSYDSDDLFSLSLYGSTRSVLTDDLRLLWSKNRISISETFKEDVNIPLPLSVRRNGSYHLYFFLRDRHGNTVKSQAAITIHRIPTRTVFNLLSDTKKSQENDTSSQSKDADEKKKASLPQTHWRSLITVNVLGDPMLFDRRSVPPELVPLVRISESHGHAYLPMFYCNAMLFREKDLLPVNASSKSVPLAITFEPISVGKLRLWRMLEHSMAQMKSMGFQDKDVEEMRGIFADTNFYFLMLTVIVATFHLLFDFLAFKNDISFWRRTKDTAGLSARTVTWRSFSSVIIFLYLMEEGTSLLVLVPSGLGTLIEFWKLTRVWKVRFGGRRLIRFETQSSDERATADFDSQGMRYLAIPMVPLCIGGAVYSLVYVPHKSWYSWTINSLANCVYAFGFLFMTPQLFINYKLKSVAHLPWKALTYKAFNTFIDDFFAFIVTMPTTHRLACFRDDVIFLIYVYQRWLYPVDKSRAAEGAQYFNDDSEPEPIKSRETKKRK